MLTAPDSISTFKLVGASLSEPHTSMTALCMCVCMLACLFVCLWPYTVNFKQACLNISQRRNVLRLIVGEALPSERSVGMKKPRVSNARMATADHGRQQQAAHRWYKLHTVVEFASNPVTWPCVFDHGTADMLVVMNPAVTNSAWFVCHDKPLNQQYIARSSSTPR